MTRIGKSTVRPPKKKKEITWICFVFWPMVGHKIFVPICGLVVRQKVRRDPVDIASVAGKCSQCGHWTNQRARNPFAQLRVRLKHQFSARNILVWSTMKTVQRFVCKKNIYIFLQHEIKPLKVALISETAPANFWFKNFMKNSYPRKKTKEKKEKEKTQIPSPPPFEKDCFWYALFQIKMYATYILLC